MDINPVGIRRTPDGTAVSHQMEYSFSLPPLYIAVWSVDPVVLPQTRAVLG